MHHALLHQVCEIVHVGRCHSQMPQLAQVACRARRVLWAMTLREQPVACQWWQGGGGGGGGGIERASGCLDATTCSNSLAEPRMHCSSRLCRADPGMPVLLAARGGVGAGGNGMGAGGQPHMPQLAYIACRSINSLQAMTWHEP